MKQDLFLVGGGGHCISCIDVLQETGLFTIRGIVEREGATGGSVLGVPVSHTDLDLPGLVGDGHSFVISIGQIKTSDPRRTMFERLLALNARIPTVVSPRAHVSRHAVLGTGVFVLHDALVNALAEVGDNTIINSKALIEHEVRIGDHCHVSTGAIVNGGVRIGSGCFIGSQAVIQEGAEVPVGTIVPAGSFYKRASRKGYGKSQES